MEEKTQRASKTYPPFRLTLLFCVFIALPVVGATAGTWMKTGVSPGQCTAVPLKTFFENYAEDVALQKKYTRFPLTLIRYQSISISDDIERFRGLLRRKVARFPLLMNKSERTKSGLSLLVIKKQSRTRKSVSVVKPDTDLQIDFYFMREKDNCWYLYKIDYGLLFSGTVLPPAFA